MEKRPYRSFFWPVILIGVGLLWLLSNLNIISSANLLVLLRLWPLLLIGIGLDLLFGRRSPLVGALLGLAMLAVVLVLVISGPQLGLAPDTQLKTESFKAPVAGANSADITLDFWSVPMQVEALPGSSPDLIEIEITHTGEATFSGGGEATRTIHFGHKENSGTPWDWMGSLGQQHGRVGLNPGVPLSLEINPGSGSASLNLASLVLERLALHSASGSVDLSLPASQENYPARINSGSGSIDVTVAEGADVDLSIESGSGSVDLRLGADSNIQAEIDSGSGSVDIDVPEGAAVRVEVRDNGSGSLNIGGNIDRVSGDNDQGVWETPGFDNAGQKIVILVVSRGSGTINIR